jgi:hypothetical protein
VSPATHELLRVVDEKGKPIRYQIIAKLATCSTRNGIKNQDLK